MLKYVTVACLLVALCAGGPEQGGPQDVQLLKYERDFRPDGYSFNYETSDGSIRKEEGTIDNSQSGNGALTVTGEYSFVNPEDGKRYKVEFTSGPNGYRPTISME